MQPIPPRNVVTGTTGDSMTCDGSVGNHFVCQAANDEMTFTPVNLYVGADYTFEARQGASALTAGVTLSNATGLPNNTIISGVNVGASNPAVIITARALTATSLLILSVAAMGNQTSAAQGVATLVNGSATVAPGPFSATAVILVTMRDPGAGAITDMAGFDVPVATRNPAGTFQVNAINGAKAVIATAVCTFDWVVFN